MTDWFAVARFDRAGGLACRGSAFVVGASILWCVALDGLAQAQIASIRATSDELTFRLGDLSRQNVEIHELPALVGEGGGGDRAPVLSSTPVDGPAEDGQVSLPRFVGQRDRLFSRFRMIDRQTGQPLGDDRFVNDLSRLPVRAFGFPTPASIKGLQVQMVDDAIKLGVKHAAINVFIDELIDWQNDSPTMVHSVDGHKVPIRASYVKRLDATIKPLTDAGINVTAIFLNKKNGPKVPENPLVHVGTDLATAPTFAIAFNLANDAAVRCFRGALEFLAERYSQPDRPHGWVTGYIIGNELQSHWMWYNLGDAGPEAVVAEYAAALRLADLAVRSVHRDLRVFASFDHHWQAKFALSETRSMSGRYMIDRLNETSKREGDFPWDVAFHPYPEDLFDPRFWQDESATLSFDSPKITFKNIEVLPAYLDQPRLRYHGQARRIILSEQGFHTPRDDTNGLSGQTVQAAAYAAAYHKLRHLEGIDSFILHRHVDHRDEGKLTLGLWTRKEDSAATPDGKKQIYEVFRLADTKQWRQAFEFAKPLIGVEAWDEMLPREIDR